MDCPACGKAMDIRRDGTWLCPDCDAKTMAELEGSMALDHQRHFGVALLLGVVTAGIYFFYYQWAVFREVDQARGDRHHGALFLAHLTFMAASMVTGWVFVARGGTIETAPWWLVLPGAMSNLLLAAYLYLEIRRFDGPAEAPMQSPWMLPAATLVGVVLGQVVPNPMWALPMLVVYGILFWMLNTSINAWWAERAHDATERSDGAVPNPA